MIPTPERLASEFSRVLRSWLTPAEMAEVNKRNAADGSDNCASHDFCDANQALLDACDALNFNVWDERDEHFSDVAQDLFDKAWTIAKANGFTVTEGAQ